MSVRLASPHVFYPVVHVYKRLSKGLKRIKNVEIKIHIILRENVTIR